MRLFRRKSHDRKLISIDGKKVVTPEFKCEMFYAVAAADDAVSIGDCTLMLTPAAPVCCVAKTYRRRKLMEVIIVVATELPKHVA